VTPAAARQRIATPAEPIGPPRHVATVRAATGFGF